MAMNRYLITYTKVATTDGTPSLQAAIEDILVNDEGFVNTVGNTYTYGNAQFDIVFSTKKIEIQNVQSTTSVGNSGQRGKIDLLEEDASAVASLFVQTDSNDDISVWIACPYSIAKDNGETWKGFYKCGFALKNNGDIVVAHSSPNTISASDFLLASTTFRRYTLSYCNFLSNATQYSVDGTPSQADLEDRTCQFYRNSDSTWYLNNYYAGVSFYKITSGKVAVPYNGFEIERPYKCTNLGIYSALQTSSGVGFSFIPAVLTKYTETGTVVTYQCKQEIINDSIPYIFMTSPKNAPDGSDLNIGSRKFQIFTGNNNRTDGKLGSDEFFAGNEDLGNGEQGMLFYQGFAFEYTTNIVYTP